MKVLFLTDGIHPFQIGGMQKHSTILISLLLDKGGQMTVVHPGGTDYSSRAFHSLFGASSNLEEYQLNFPKTDPLPGHYVRENKKYSEQAYLHFQDELAHFDLIYAQGFTGWYFLKKRKSGDLSVPVLVNFHGFEMFQKPPSLRVKAEYVLLRKTVRWMVQNADFVYSFGAQIDTVLKRLGVPDNRVLLQSNGIREEWLKHSVTDHPEMNFIFIGRNERRKGILELNEALKELMKTKAQFSFHFVGPIPEDSRLKDDRIIYYGEIREAERIKEILDACDCLVCPSHSEGMPTVILEAMARGLAVIGTDVGAVSRQIDGNGILLSGPDQQELQRTLLELIETDSSKLMEMKEKSLELIREKFLWEVIADQKIEDFKKVST